MALYEKYRADADERPSKNLSDKFSRTFVWVENDDISLIKPLKGASCRDIPRSHELPEWALDAHGTPSPEKLWIKELADQGCVPVRLAMPAFLAREGPSFCESSYLLATLFTKTGLVESQNPGCRGN